MKNPFKEITPKHKVSPLVKQKVLLDINLIKNTLDIAELYILKHPKILSSILMH